VGAAGKQGMASLKAASNAPPTPAASSASSSSSSYSSSLSAAASKGDSASAIGAFVASILRERCGHDRRPSDVDVRKCWALLQRSGGAAARLEPVLDRISRILLDHVEGQLRDRRAAEAVAAASSRAQPGAQPRGGENGGEGGEACGVGLGGLERLMGGSWVERALPLRARLRVMHDELTCLRLHRVLDGLGGPRVTGNAPTVSLMAAAVDRFNTMRLSDLSLLVHGPRVRRFEDKVRRGEREQMPLLVLCACFFGRLLRCLAHGLSW